MSEKEGKERFIKGSFAIIGVVAGLVLLIVVGIFVVKPDIREVFTSGEESGEEKDKASKVVDFIKHSTPTPTPFPFQELTIPHLREREYESTLNDLEEIGRNSNYTSYLASYESDGLKVIGFLTIPEDAQPRGGWPAIVFVHGYIPPSTYQTTQNYSSYVDYLARGGFVVFKIDLRGHAQSEGEPGGAYYSSDYIVDTLSAYSALAASDFVNPERIGLWGHSMAGNVVFRSFVAGQEIPAAVIWAGAVYTYEDFQDFHISDNSYRPPPQDSQRRRYREELMETYGEFDAESEFWSQVVPVNYLDGVTGAIQVNHAVNDPVVDINYSRNLMSILDGTSITHELVEYQSGGHNLTGDSFDSAMQNTVEFFESHL
jgi:dipeptidyl aminopeptidase/acylaminoacyl peptidase